MQSFYIRADVRSKLLARNKAIKIHFLSSTIPRGSGTFLSNSKEYVTFITVYSMEKIEMKECTWYYLHLERWCKKSLGFSPIELLYGHTAYGPLKVLNET